MLCHCEYLMLEYNGNFVLICNQDFSNKKKMIRFSLFIIFDPSYICVCDQTNKVGYDLTSNLWIHMNLILGTMILFLNS